MDSDIVFDSFIDDVSTYIEQIDRHQSTINQLRAEIVALKKEIEYLQDELMDARGDTEYYRAQSSTR